MILDTYTKQPAEVLDYDIDYTDWLETGDTIASKTVTAETGLTVDSSAIWGASKKVKVWISGGTNGTTYKVTVTIVTVAGCTKEDEFRMKIKET